MAAALVADAAWRLLLGLPVAADTCGVLMGPADRGVDAHFPRNGPGRVRPGPQPGQHRRPRAVPLPATGKVRRPSATARTPAASPATEHPSAPASGSPRSASDCPPKVCPAPPPTTTAPGPPTARLKDPLALHLDHLDAGRGTKPTFRTRPGIRCSADLSMAASRTGRRDRCVRPVTVVAQLVALPVSHRGLKPCASPGTRVLPTVHPPSSRESDSGWAGAPDGPACGASRGVSDERAVGVVRLGALCHRLHRVASRHRGHSQALAGGSRSEGSGWSNGLTSASSQRMRTCPVRFTSYTLIVIMGNPRRGR